MKTAITFNSHQNLHFSRGHQERPERVQSIRNLLEQDGILGSLLTPDFIQATEDDILLVHPASYYQRLRQTAEAGSVWLDPDTYSTPDSLNVAVEGVSQLLSLTKAVGEGRARNGFAVIRPPGHHARFDEAMGFCLLANVAIAVRWAQHRLGAERVLVIDYDVHHGNGTQEIFYDDPDVLFVSAHQHPFYPGTGALQETGQGAGTGATVNIPLPAQTGDESYLHVFETILRPRVLRFNPDLIFVSAGYDAHWLDPLGGMNLSIHGFGSLVREILRWAGECCAGKCIFALEGGYHADALAHATLTTLRLLQDEEAPISDPFGPYPAHVSPTGVLLDYIQELAAFHSS